MRRQTLRPRPVEALVAVDVDTSGNIVVYGTAANTADAFVEGSPEIVAGPNGMLDAIQFSTGSFIQLGSYGVDTDNTWTVDCYIFSQMAFDVGRWGTLTRGRANDPQIIVKNNGHELGGYENGRRNFVLGTGWMINSLSYGWHRLTVSSGCANADCSTRLTIYYIDGAEIARTDATRRGETDFLTIGNYLNGAQPWRGTAAPFPDLRRASVTVRPGVPTCRRSNRGRRLS